MTNKEIHEVCAPCGVSANVLTCLKKFGRAPLKLAFDVSTFRKGECPICGEKDVYLTEVRDFFNPDFSLLTKAMHKACKKIIKTNAKNDK